MWLDFAVWLNQCWKSISQCSRYQSSCPANRLHVYFVFVFVRLPLSFSLSALFFAFFDDYYFFMCTFFLKLYFIGFFLFTFSVFRLNELHLSFLWQNNNELQHQVVCAWITSELDLLWSVMDWIWLLSSVVRSYKSNKFMHIQLIVSFKPIRC